jgi:hypothetical protein
LSRWSGILSETDHFVLLDSGTCAKELAAWHNNNHKEDL